MRTKTGPNGSADKHVKEIKRKTRRQLSVEENIRIVLDGLRGESSISELCRRDGIAESLYYNWSKDFMEAGKKRLIGDTTRQATSSEVTGLKLEARDLKEVVAEQTLELRLLKKSMLGDGGGLE
jgi:transposase